MPENLFNKLILISPQLKAILWKYLYQWSAQLFPMADWKFMNFGYAPLDDETETLDLEDQDIENRYPIQLYHHVASLVHIRNLNVLEVGSGRGGGADYIKRYLQPHSVVGIDFSKELVSFCKRSYQIAGLTFQVGNAESLPFEDASFEMVINVESSHCYSSLDVFFSQVRRVLCTDGYFLFADFRDLKDIDAFLESLDQSGFTLLKQTDITANVIKAMELDHERKMNWIQQSVNKLLIPMFSDIAGTKESSIYKKFKNGETIYQSFLLQKQME